MNKVLKSRRVLSCCAVAVTVVALRLAGGEGGADTLGLGDVHQPSLNVSLSRSSIPTYGFCELLVEIYPPHEQELVIPPGVVEEYGTDNSRLFLEFWKQAGEEGGTLWRSMHVNPISSLVELVPMAPTEEEVEGVRTVSISPGHEAWDVPTLTIPRGHFARFHCAIGMGGGSDSVMEWRTAKKEKVGGFLFQAGGESYSVRLAWYAEDQMPVFSNSVALTVVAGLESEAVKKGVAMMESCELAGMVVGSGVSEFSASAYYLDQVQKLEGYLQLPEAHREVIGLAQSLTGLWAAYSHDDYGRQQVDLVMLRERLAGSLQVAKNCLVAAEYAPHRWQRIVAQLEERLKIAGL